MSIESVREHLSRAAPDIVILETEASSATVEEAAAAHSVLPAQIAKTLSFSVKDEVFLLVTGGDARIDNKKAKTTFGGKVRMLALDDVEAITGHPVGGVCPFGLAQPIKVYCDESLRAFSEVIPAAGSRNAAVRITPQRMAEITNAGWVDVCKEPAA